MERTISIVKATFKSRSEKQLEYILQKLKEIFGQQNVIALTPSYRHRCKIYVLDMDIRIPNALLRYDLDFRTTKISSGGTS